MIGAGGVRSATAIAGTCTVLITAAVGVGQLAPGGTACLQFGNRIATNSAALDPLTGASFGLDPTGQANNQGTQFSQAAGQTLLLQIAPSPNGKRLAYDLYDAASQRSHLIVEANENFHMITTQNAPPLVGDVNQAGYAGRRDFGWSPDGKWLLYWWREADGSASIGLADPDGRPVRSQPSGAAASSQSVSYLGWSPDGKYAAFSIRDSYNPNSDMLAIWSMPDLKAVASLPYVMPAVGSNTGPNGFFGPVSMALAWAPRGQRIAYLTEDMTAHITRLAIATPGATPTLADLPGQTVYPTFGGSTVNAPNGRNNGYFAGGSLNALPTLSWSTDGRFVIVSRPVDSGERLDVVNANSLDVHGLTGDAAALLSGGFRSPYSLWSADGHALYYMQPDSYNNQSNQNSQIDLFVFHPATGIIELIAANVTPSSGQQRLGSGEILFQQQAQDSNGAANFLLLKTATGQIMSIAPPASDNPGDTLLDRQFLGASRNGDRMVFADYARASDGALGSTITYIWTSDASGSSRILYTANGQTYSGSNSGGQGYSGSAPNFPVPSAFSPFRFGGGQVSPDGRWLALTDSISGQSGGSLSLIPLDSDQAKAVNVSAPDLSFLNPIAWRADSAQLLLNGSQTVPGTSTSSQVFILVDVSTGTVSRVIDAPGFRAGSFAPCR